jgi:2-polyprenyl-3-methyl-5-hydroxy-6-metoxy-1,4-benzoquinol methylase
MATKPSIERYTTWGIDDRYGRNNIFVDWASASGGWVLEAGCANGYISRRLVERGCHVVGLEIDAEAAAQARAYCEQVFVVDLNTWEWTGALTTKFNTVLFGDVLEQLIDPERVLRDAAHLLNPDGRVIVCLPNVAHWTIRLELLRGKFLYTETGILDGTHLRFYTPQTAREMIQRAGYEIIRTQAIIAGRLTGRLRPFWQFMANCVPGLFAFQMMFLLRLNPGAATRDSNC